MKDQAASLRELVHGKNEYLGKGHPPAEQTAASEPAAPERRQPVTLMQPSGGGEVRKPRIFRPNVRTGARSIAITSGKGGVGKTNLTVNLAIALMKFGRRVIIIDADLGMANVDVVLGSVSKHHLMHLLEPDVTLQDVLIEGPFGVRYISGGSAIDRSADFSESERDILMEKLAGCDDLADIVLIDTGAGLGQNVQDFILAADEVVLVTTPEPTSLTDAYAVMKAYSMKAVSKNMKIVVNRIYDEDESQDVLTKLRRTSERFLQMPLASIGGIYEDRDVMNAVKRQSPLMIAYPDSLAARCIQAIAKNLLFGGQHSVRWGWKGFLKRLLKFH